MQRLVYITHDASLDRLDNICSVAARFMLLLSTFIRVKKFESIRKNIVKAPSFTNQR